MLLGCNDDAVTANGLTSKGNRRRRFEISGARAITLAVGSAVTFLGPVNSTVTAGPFTVDRAATHGDPAVLARTIHVAVAATLIVALLTCVKDAVAAEILAINREAAFRFEACRASAVRFTVRAPVSVALLTRVQVAVTAEGLAVDRYRRCGLMVGIAHASRTVASTVTFLTSIDRSIAANTLAANCQR